MTSHPEPSMLAVLLCDRTVDRLFRLRQSDSETIDSVVARLASNECVLPKASISKQHALNTAERCKPTSLNLSPRKAGFKYRLHFLGEELCANSLGNLYAELIDALEDVAPEAIERLATIKSRKRAFVSRQRGMIHPGRPDLKTLKTRAGWWVSGNIGLIDFNRALEALCAASGLAVNKDVRLS